MKMEILNILSELATTCKILSQKPHSLLIMKIYIYTINNDTSVC